MGRPSGVQAGRRAGLLGVRRDAPGGRARLEAAVHDHAQPGAHVPHRPPELRARGAVSVRFLPAGDLAVLVEFDEEISVEVNTRVRALEFLIQQKGLTGVVETVPTFRSLLALYDPESPEPVLLRPGDRVSFRAIDRGEYDTIAARVVARAYAPVIT